MAPLKIEDCKVTQLQLIPVENPEEVLPGTDLVAFFEGAVSPWCEGDILVVSSKVVSKAEGRIVAEGDLCPSKFAEHLAQLTGKSPAYCELVLQESAGVLRTAPGAIICKTHHGFVLANAGVDASNAGGKGRLIPLPVNPDLSARRLGQGLSARCGVHIAVVISDTFGRPWRRGQVDLAIGCWGLEPLHSYAGCPDDDGRQMSQTCIAVADELASAADLVAGKTRRVPGVVVRGYACTGEGSAQELLMPAHLDLFP